MSYLYVNENGTIVGIEGNRFTVKYKDGMLKSVPAETLEGITILGSVQITSKCMEECLQRGIPVSYFSKGGRYYGRLMSTGHVKAQLQRKQAALYDTQFALELSQKIIQAKLQNQLVVLRRYARSRNVEIKDIEIMLANCISKTQYIHGIEELMGYEGTGAKYYFEGLSRCIEEDFVFKGRSKRPPLDAFNSMLSLGYSVLMNEVYGAIETKGLNPYFGFMHRDAEKHPTLASDMMEEWRAVLIDSTVMSMINGHEISHSEFYNEIDRLGVFMTKDSLRKYLSKLEKKFQTESRYLGYVDYAVSFRRGIALQMKQLVNAIEAEDASIYTPIRIR